MNKKGVMIASVSVLLTIILVLLYCYEDEMPSSKEVNYQEGIKLIEQGKWEEAGISLVKLGKQNYKDAEALYDYSNAKEHIEQGNGMSDISMALHYLENIPDTYAGLFNNDIAQFKQECKRLNEKAEQDYIDSDYHKLEVVSFRWHNSNSYATAEGQIKNTSSESLNNVMAVITYKTQSGTFITFDKALIEYQTLLPDQTSPFKVITPYNPEMAIASLEITDFNGNKIPADYTYNK